MSITANLRGSIVVGDNTTGSVSLQKPINLAYNGTAQSFGNLVIGLTPTTIPLPGSPVEFCYIRNLSPTNGTTLIIQWSPEGSSTINVITLDAGAAIIFTEMTSTNGIASLIFSSNTPGTPCEYILVS